MRKFYTIIIGFFPIVMMAQNYAITGKVLDGTDPVEYATVSVLKSSDRLLVTGAITDQNGEFRINVEQGSYVVKIEFVTYEDFITEPGQVGPGNPRWDLGTVAMRVSETELDEVVVQGERTQMELKLDKKVYNVGKDLSNLGGSASDLLDNLPSVTVDVEGNVSLRGSSNVRVLIDGKPSGLVGLSSTDALRQLQGNLIESVEIITNPSARYDAEGMAGIINIIMKKEQQKGVNGSFQLNTGYPHNHGASVNMNFRRKWVNLFVNYGADYRQNPGRGGSFQTFDFPDTTYFTDRRREHLRGGFSNNIRFGADFYLGENSVLTTSFLYRYSKELNEAELVYEDLNEDREVLSYTLREDEEKEGDENLEYAVNYTRQFSRDGHKLTADVQYQNNNEIERSDIIQSSGSNRNTLMQELLQNVRNDEGEERLMIQSDYIQPFNHKGKIEAGFRSTIRNVKNIYLVQQANESGQFVRLDSFSTDFAYNERVHGFYGIVSNEYSRISWQAGLRSEVTDISTRFQETNRQRNWNYVNFFPSVFFTYKLKAENQFQLSYSRRIDRPRFRLLNPFSSFTDTRNLRVGNPDLQPEFTDSYEAGFLQNLDKSSLYYGVYHRHTTGVINRVNLEPTEDGVRVTVPYNIGTSDAIGAEVNATHEFADWYRIAGNFNFYWQETRGSVGDTVDLGAQTVTFSTRISNTFRIPKVFDLQANFNYEAPENEPQGRQLAVYVLDLGMSRDIWNNNGTIALSVRDVFNSRKWRNITELENFYEESEWQWRRGPNFSLSLTYRLNQKKRERPEGNGNDFGDGGDGGF